MLCPAALCIAAYTSSPTILPPSPLPAVPFSDLPIIRSADPPLSLTPTPPSPPSSPAPDLTKLPDVNRYLSRISGFGYSGTVLVAKGDRVLFCKGYGLADREKRVRCGRETVYEIGSLSKQFTATAIMKLREDHLLKLDDTLGKLLPGVPDEKKGITIEQLLTHTSGMGRVPEEYTEVSRDDRVSQILSRPLLFPPGTSNAYSSEGYTILARVIEEVSKEPFQRYLQEHLFKPAGLTHTGWGGKYLPKAKDCFVASGYDGLRLVEDLHKWFGGTWDSMGGGGMTSTAPDLVKWYRALAAGKVIGADSLKRMWTKHVTGAGSAQDYGYGWFITENGADIPMIEHAGDGWAFGSDLQIYPQSGLAVVSLANVRQDLYPTQIKAGDVIPMILWKKKYESGPDWKRSSIAEAALGTYRLDSGGTFQLFRKQGQVYAGCLGQDALDATVGGDKLSLEMTTALNESALKALRGAEVADFKPLDDALGGGPHPHFEAGWKGESASIRGSRGDLVSITSMGTFRSWPGWETLLTFAYTHGTNQYYVRWTRKTKVIIEGTLIGPPLAGILPVQASGPQSLLAWDIRTNRGYTIRIRDNAIFVRPSTGAKETVAKRAAP